MSWFSGISPWEWIFFPIAITHVATNAMGITGRSGGRAVPGVQARRIQTSEEGNPIPVIYGRVRAAGNVLWMKGPNQASDGSYTIRMMLGLCEGPIVGIGRYWAGAEEKTFPAGNLVSWELLSGARSQAAWSWLAANGFSAEALGYGGTAHACHPAIPSDAGGNFQPLTWEIFGLLADVAHSYDALATGIIQDVLTSTQYGASWPGTKLASMATGQDGLAASSAERYCQAMGFYISVDLRDQATALEVLSSILAAINCTAIRSGAQLKILPLGDTEVTEGAFTYTPCTVIRAALTSADYLCGENEDPIRVSIRSRAEVFNDWPIEYTDAEAGYEMRTVSFADAADVDEFGIRKAEVISQPYITRGKHATALSKILAQQSIHTRRSFEFTLPLRHCRLEQLDLVSLTDARLGLSAFVVRIETIEEVDYQGDKAFRFVAEEYVQGAAHAIGYTPQPPGGTATNTGAAPGNANAPVLAQAPAAYAGGKQRLFVVTSGGADWGGAEVWTSWDDATWSYQGTILRGVHGALSAILASGSDPDLVNTLAVDLATSGGQLPNASTTERDALSTLCYVDGEWVSYAASSNPTGTSTNLTSLRRGVWGSTIASHAAASVFAKVSAETFRLDIDTARVGQTLYLRLVSFNKWGRALQDIAALSSHSVVIAAQRAVVPPGTPFEFSQDSAPTVRPDGSPLQVGDLWTETDNGNKRHRWSGSAWLALPIGAPAIGSGEVDWSRISAGQGNTANLWPNPTSEVAPPTGADTTGAEWKGRTSIGDAPAGSYVRRITADSVYLWIPCVVGDQYLLQAVARWVSGTGSGYLGVAFYQADQSTIVGSETTSTITSAMTTFATRGPVTATAGAGAVWVRFRISSDSGTTCDFDQLHAYRMIEAGQLRAQSVLASNIQGDALATTDWSETSDVPESGAKMVANTTYTAWASNTAYVEGDKRSNGGKVYRCSVAGTSAGGAAAWGSGTTYAVGNLVSYSGRTYYSLQGGNTNHQPDTNPAWWEDRGANTGPALTGFGVVLDGTAVWIPYAQLRVSPSGIQLGSATLDGSWFTQQAYDYVTVWLNGTSFGASGLHTAVLDGVAGNWWAVDNWNGTTKVLTLRSRIFRLRGHDIAALISAQKDTAGGATGRNIRATGYSTSGMYLYLSLQMLDASNIAVDWSAEGTGVTYRLLVASLATGLLSL